MDTPSDLTPRVLEALCHRALGHDIEFTSSGFWQAQLQSQFKLEDGFVVLCEQSPDKNDRTRIDQIVFCLRPTGLVAQLCLVEGKRRGPGTKHIAEAEMQAYKGASKTLNFTGDHIVHIMTSWGICFRTWELEIGGSKLVPLNGGPDIPGHRNSYLNIRNPSHNATFNNFVLAVKKQALGKQGAQHTGRLGAGDGDAGGYGDADAQGYADVGAGGSNTGASGSKPWVEVTVTVEPHLISETLWIFKDGSKVYKVPKSDWKKGRHNNEKVWACRVKKTSFFTRQKLPS